MPNEKKVKEIENYRPLSLSTPVVSGIKLLSMGRVITLVNSRSLLRTRHTNIKIKDHLRVKEIVPSLSVVLMIFGTVGS